MMKTMKKSIILALAAATLASSAMAAPATLDGMGMVSQWTDFESGSGEVPLLPWANSDVVNANRVGIWVRYANGLTGSASYSGVAGGWGGCCSIGAGVGITPDTETGFFVGTGNYANLHGLDNTGPGFPLPMAFVDLSNAFTGNFDVSYENFGNSTFRASVGGWESVQIALYSSAAAVAVPEPGTMALFGLGMLGLGLGRRRKA
ncbi:MAG: PEP-CTERM sorting domain-containing protein [Pseudomonadota bacterium]